MERELSDKLPSLSTYQMLVWGYLLCEDLYPHYVAFTDHSVWGSPRILRAALDWIREVILQQGQFDVASAQAYANQVEQATPDLDDLNKGVLPSAALDTCTSILELLQFMISRDLENLINVASCAGDTVDMYVQVLHDLDPNAPDLENQITNDPFMQHFLVRVKSLTTAVQAVPTADNDFLDSQLASQPLIDLQLLRQKDL